ncbi:unnamed protein product, partial [marine sediment metagenome]
VILVCGEKLDKRKSTYKKINKAKGVFEFSKLTAGDHGRIEYDEVNGMRLFLENKNVPTENIFMDHAGFSTYETMYRAKEIFCVDKAIIVTQEYHLKRIHIFNLFI